MTTSPRPTSTCPSCGGNQAEGLLCSTCVLKLRHDLKAVPELVEDLAISISRMDKLTSQEPGGKANARERWAINVDSSAVAWELETTLTRWAAEIARVLRYAPPRRAATSSAALLLAEMPTVRSHPEAATIVEQVNTAVANAHEHVLGPRERTRIPVGPCPEFNHDGSHCEGTVVAYIPRQDAAPSRMQCKANPDHRWASVQFFRAGKRIRDRADQLRRGA